ncbi:sulfotransferase family protein [uncultured Sphingomonas sp.]|uniref:sulfotransferase family protein n=1 Tax=uncultured Sphingomonas sp. TaxID=158754 RepID=UPI0025E15A1C|nr:sulfotransferase family protein [uncultured Sphingomonas sp.]
MNRAAILVLGMHRSGTSALTWLVGKMGAALPSDAIRPSGENARGYWESEGLVKADDQLLRVCRSSWFDPRPLDWSRLDASALGSRKARMREAIERGWGTAPLIAIKDPRQCRCVPVIVDVLDDMGIAPRALLMLRAPGEIARSLESRDGTTAAFAQLLWLRHMIDAERATRGMMRAVVDYDGMLADWRGTVRAIAPLAGRDGWLPEGAEAEEIDRFLDPTLRHHSIVDSRLEEPLAGIVAAVDGGLRQLAERDDAVAWARLDEAYARLDAAPWLEGDIVHDELRHRRASGDPAPAAVIAPEPQAAPAPSPEPERPRPAPLPDPTGDADLIRSSNLFDTDWYLARYPEARDSGMDPVDHYVRIGAPKGYNPGPLFDTLHYARQMAQREGGNGAPN